FVHYFNTIDTRANFFGASNVYEQNQGSGAKWFEGAEKVSRACFTGLGADGCASYLSFYLAKIFSGNPDLYGWRKEAGDTLMKSGFTNFRELYNNKGINPMEWDIKQLKSEQSVLQPIHEKYLGEYGVFRWGSQKAMDNNKGVKLFNFFNNLFDLEKHKGIDGGVDILNQKSRIEYGCMLLGYTKEQGCM
ncbi:hemagglutinin, partial [Pelistega sp. NLN82]